MVWTGLFFRFAVVWFFVTMSFCKRGKVVSEKRQASARSSSGALTSGLVKDREEMEGEIERLGRQGDDFLVVGISAPSFSKLSLRSKLLAYWLNMAAIAGNDILYLQNHRYALQIKKLCEQTYLATSDLTDRNLKRIRDHLLDYLKYIWINHGHYDHREGIKFVPNYLRQEELIELVDAAMREGARLEFLKGKTAREKLAPLLPHIFDMEVEPALTVRQEGKDIVASSWVNFYDPGITEGDIESLDSKWRQRLNVRFALRGGRVEPEVFRSGGVYGKYIDKIVHYLQQAIRYASSEEMSHSIQLLIKFYQTGEEKYFRQHSRVWLGLDEEIEYVNGFIEQLKDPRGVIGNFEGMSAVRADSTMVRKIADDWLYFERKMPWPDKYKRDTFKKGGAVIVEVLMGTGDMGPVPWGGFNLPNYDEIRHNYGSKNVILLNILNSYSKVERKKVIDEFYPPSVRADVESYYDLVRKLMVFLHEVIGHASGRQDEKLSDEPRSLMGRNFTALEECRADLVALYHIGDEKLSQYGFYSPAQRDNVVKAAYQIYLTSHMIKMGSFGKDLPTGAHDKASHLIFQYLLEGGCLKKSCPERKDFGVKLIKARDGVHYIEVSSIEKVTAGIGELLNKIQVAKSLADREAQDRLFDSISVYPDLKREVGERKKSLGLATRRAIVYPHLSLVRDSKGNVIDVEIKNDEDLVKQQFRFSSICG